MAVTKTGFELVSKDFLTLERKLKKLGDPRRIKKARIKALKEGAKEVDKEVKKEIDRVPDDRLQATGKDRFKKSMSIQQRSNKRDSGAVVIGPAFSGKKHIAPDFHLFEFGTDERTTSSGASRGRISPPLGMFRKGWEQSRDRAQAKVLEILTEFINGR